jgi:hypothetical protein
VSQKLKLVTNLADPLALAGIEAQLQAREDLAQIEA